MTPSSHTSTEPWAAASRAASSPAAPAPITSVSTCDVTHHVSRRSRGVGQRPEARGTADHPFGDRPGEPRPDEGLVVEPDRHQPMQGIGHVQQIALGARPPSCAFDPHPLGTGGHAGMHGRVAVDRHQAVRTVAGAAVETTSPVVLQRTRERAHAVAVERRRDRVAVGEGHLATLERERAHLSPRPGPRRRSFACRVTIVVHVRHPIAWNQRSRCGPSGFSGRYTRAKSASASGASSSRHSPPKENSVLGRSPQWPQGMDSVIGRRARSRSSRSRIRCPWGS